MSEYDDWKQENDRWEAYLYPNGVLRNKLGITKAAKWHKMERDFGTTSAHAENTPTAVQYQSYMGNYLRARGEYAIDVGCVGRNRELPPRTRRIHAMIFNQQISIRTTSAHAENTSCSDTPRVDAVNYLRARGEYLNELGLLWHDSQKWAKIRSGI